MKKRTKKLLAIPGSTRGTAPNAICKSFLLLFSKKKNLFLFFPRWQPVTAPEVDKATALRLADLQDSHGCFETLIQRCYEAELRPSDTAIDRGANYGTHTGPMAQAVGPSGKIHAFEPLPFAAEALRSILKRYPNVVVHELALAETDGLATFHCIVQDPALSSLLDRDLGPSYVDAERRAYLVRRVALDQFSDLPIRFIKLDLEGYDFHALKGARNILTKHRPIVTMECGRIDAAAPAGYSSDDFFGYAREIGYEIVDLFGPIRGRRVRPALECKGSTARRCGSANRATGRFGKTSGTGP